MESSPTTSPLLQLIDALNRAVDPEHHTRVISDALEHAGLVDIPRDREAFRTFVSGPLSVAATTLLGTVVATELVWTLMRMTSVRAPSSRMPRPTARYETAEYTDDVFVPRADVLLVGAETPLFDQLRALLEARGYRVETVDAGDAADRLGRDPPPRAILTHVELEAGLRHAARARRDFGSRAPGVIVLTEESFLPDPPEGVDRIMSAAAVVPIVSALVKILNPRQTDPITHR